MEQIVRTGIPTVLHTMCTCDARYGTFPGPPMLLIGVLSVPLGLAVFHRGERYAKQHGKLKRSG